ncbi:response regulator [Winogradskyella sp. 3972H.M.0a.05]|uniref:response regulator n=1 Tax=Winogradskyella sp. 3972H.M.0a.05 TaxID=2950277 RepID=UPI00339B8CA7
MIKKEDISLILADDHPMLLKGLYDELSVNNYNVVGQANNGMQALELVLKLKPTIALLDIDMPLLTGFEVVKMAKEKGTSTKFIILSYHKEIDYITKAKTLQLNGYLLKEDSFFEIERCIEAVLDDEIYFSNSFDNLAIENASEELKRLKLLTPSEVTILKLIVQGMTNTELSDNLGVSVRTVEKHRSNIVNKLEIEGGTNAVINWALKHKDVIIDF